MRVCSIYLVEDCTPVGVQFLFLWLKFVGTRFDFIEAFSVASISKPLLLYEPGYFFIDAPVPHVLLMELLVIHGLGVL